MSELKPCPFCGNVPILKEVGNDRTKKRHAEIYCKGCCTRMQVGAIRNNMQWCVDVVTEQWNTRQETPK